MRNLLLLAVAACAACSDSSSVGPDVVLDASTSPDARDGSSVAPDASDASDASASPADAAPPATTVRVHYPAGAHTVSLRGSGGGLNWTTGVKLPGSGDVYSYSLASLASTIEFKPLLDDSTWARGPNYRLAPGASVDLYPHFNSKAGKVVTLIAAFHSAALNNDRPVYAYLPASYDENTDADYPVVYMHDGQNLWAALPQLAFGATWNVDTAFDTATEVGACSSASLAGWGAQPLGGNATTCNGDGDCNGSGACVTFPEAIVIGVGNTAGRIYEYTPTTDPSTPGGGGADKYLQLLVSELKPVIDTKLRVRKDAASTTIMGSSLGGLVSAYAGLKHPEVFSRIGELSPSTWWNNGVIITDVQGTLASPNRPAIVYVDSGQGNTDGQADTDKLAQTYVNLGYVDGKDFRHVVQAGALHSEVYWAQRLPGALQLLLGAR